MTNALGCYSRHRPITVPNEYAGRLAGRPTSLDQLRRAVQGLILHVFWPERYGVTLTPEREQETQLPWVARQLERPLALDARPLAEPRPPERRVVGNCRDISVLLGTLLGQDCPTTRERNSGGNAAVTSSTACSAAVNLTANAWRSACSVRWRSTMLE